MIPRLGFDLVEDARELKLLRVVGPGFECIYDIGRNIGLHTNLLLLCGEASSSLRAPSRKLCPALREHRVKGQEQHRRSPCRSFGQEWGVAILYLARSGLTGKHSDRPPRSPPRYLSLSTCRRCGWMIFDYQRPI